MLNSLPVTELPCDRRTFTTIVDRQQDSTTPHIHDPLLQQRLHDGWVLLNVPPPTGMALVASQCTMGLARG
jgi:hypothetical protein